MAAQRNPTAASCINELTLLVWERTAMGLSRSALWPDFAFTPADRFQLFLDVFATNGVGMCWTFSLPHFGQFG